VVIVIPHGRDMDLHMAGATVEDGAEVFEGASGPVQVGVAVMAEVSHEADFLPGADGMDRPMVALMPWTPKTRSRC